MVLKIRWVEIGENELADRGLLDTHMVQCPHLQCHCGQLEMAVSQLVASVPAWCFGQFNIRLGVRGQNWMVESQHHQNVVGFVHQFTPRGQVAITHSDYTLQQRSVQLIGFRFAVYCRNSGRSDFRMKRLNEILKHIQISIKTNDTKSNDNK